jgi:hypothetical protein
MNRIMMQTRRGRSVALLACLALTAVDAMANNNRRRPDFNGDGIADIAIGVPNETIGEADSTGLVHVLCGSQPGGLVAPGQKIHSGMIVLAEGIAGNQDGLEFGRTLAWGDFNDDGFDDLVVGMPKHNAGVWVDTGLVYVLYGGPPTPQWTCGVRTVGVHHFMSTFLEPVDANLEHNDYFGAALAAGDFNGDGVDDLAVGVPGQDLKTNAGVVVANAGEVLVIYGRLGFGLDRTRSFALNRRAIPPFRFDLAGEPEAGDRLGHSLAAGDFNGDNVTDLAIGVPGDNAARGSVNVVRGCIGAGLGACGSLYLDQNTAGMVPSAPGAQKLFGFALAVADFDFDSRDDLAIGAPRAAPGGHAQSGEVAVVYGDAVLGLSPIAGPLGGGNQLFTQLTPGIGDDGLMAGDQFGYSLATGEFGGDVAPDLAIGKPFDDPGAVNSAGSVTILFGSAGPGLSALGSQFWTQDSAFVPGIIGNLDLFGHSLFAADFDNNGRDDLAIGVPGDIVGPTRCGSVTVLQFGPGAPPHRLLHQNLLAVPAAIGACEAGDNFGTVSTSWI